ncbi:hypothetical protein D3C76_337010 [compost metagenome]
MTRGQAQRRSQGQATGLARRQQGLAEIAEESGQQVGAGGHHTDPQQLGGEEIRQGQETGQQRQQDQPDPHHDHERNQPGKAGRPLQLMLAQRAAVAQQRHREDHPHHQCGQAVGGHGQRQAGADHAVDALLGQQHHQRQGQQFREPAQGAGHFVVDRRQPPRRALQHQHGAAQARDEGAEHHQGEYMIGQAGQVRTQFGAAFQAPTQQRHGTGDGAEGGEADAQRQGAAAQAAFGQPADHGVGQQALKQAAHGGPDQYRGHQAGDEPPAVLGAERTGQGVGGLATQIAQARHVVVGRADQRLPERRGQRAGRAAGDLRVELAATQVDDLRGQVASRLGQLDCGLLLGEHGFFLGFELTALAGNALGFIRLHRAQHLELIVQAFDIGSAHGTQGISLALDVHGGLTQLREQVVVGVVGHALADLVEPIVELFVAGALIERRQLGDSGQGRHRRGRGRPGRGGQGHHQG